MANTVNEQQSTHLGLPPGDLSAVRSTHTDSFPALLRQCELSVLVSTYQAGKLIVLRADGDLLNTHFRGFNKPMGLAINGGRLAIGTALEIWEFHNVPAVAGKLEPAGRCDAVFLPRGSHTTGDIQIHEMAWAGGELVFVNTRFSCLCVRSGEYSFQPVWRPRFVSALSPDDRCHLNGLGLYEGQVQWVTALGATDSAGGWREGKRDGGVLLDVPTGETIAAGLSMPHSPRWHDGRLWLLESGTGTFGAVDPARGRYEPLLELPGFSRGLAFHGPYAFIGLSQVRESAVFSGIPLVERLDRRACGVWVVDLRLMQTVAWVEFEEGVQEIFAVEVLGGLQYPDVINDDYALLGDTFVVPDAALDEVSPSYQLSFEK
jgi:uncharacterized protein (TIGR03032 family)